MSKAAKYTAKIKKADQKILDAAIQNMIKTLKVQIMTGNTFQIYGRSLNRQGTTIKLPNMAYPVDVFIEDGQIKLQGDSMDLHYATQIVEQFYKTTYMQQQVQGLNLNGLNTNLSYNERTEKTKLEVAWF
jgi:hypothetical protein